MLESFIGFCICAILIILVNETSFKPMRLMIDKIKSTINGSNKKAAVDAMDDVCTNITKLNQEAYISSIIDTLEKTQADLNRYKALYIEYREKYDKLQNELRKREESTSNQ